MKCEHCQRKYSSLKTLKFHIKHKHALYVCSYCSKTFCLKSELTTHFDNVFCKYCSLHFKNKKILIRHQLNCDAKFSNLLKDLNQKKVICTICNHEYPYKFYFNHKKSNAHLDALMKAIEKDLYVLDSSAFDGNIKRFKIQVSNEFSLNLKECLNHYYDKIKKLLLSEIAIQDAIKFKILFVGIYHINVESLEIKECIKTFSSKFTVSLNEDELEEKICKIFLELCERATEFNQSQSGWQLLNINCLYIDIIKYVPLFGGSYIATPKKIKKKNCVLNIKNDVYNCFLLSVCAHFYSHLIDKKDRERESAYKFYLKKFNCNDISFPVCVGDIKRFEKNNFENFNLSINVFTYNLKKKSFGVLYTSTNEGINVVDLILFVGDHENHFALILDLSRLLRSTLTKSTKKIHICRKCLKYYAKKEMFDRHKAIGCSNVKIQIPSDPFLRFKNYKAKIPLKFLCFGDIETLSLKIQSCKPDINRSFIYNTDKHVAFLCAYKIWSITNDENLERWRLFRGENCVLDMLKKIYLDVKYIYYKYFFIIHPCTILPEDTMTFLKTQNKCNICQKPIGENSFDIEHDHSWPMDFNLPNYDNFPQHLFRGNVRGIAHQGCNKSARNIFVFPVIFHNFSSFDSHFLILELAKLKIGKINVIARTRENYLLVTWKVRFENKFIEIRFIDSYKFLSSSLSNIIESCDDFPIFKKALKREYPQLEFDENLLKKQFLPYSYLNSFEVLKEKNFPPRNVFYNDLKDEILSLEDWKYAKKIFQTLGCKNLEDYCIFYLFCDIYLAIDCILKFRDIIFKTFQIEAFYYVSLASLTLDCALDFTGENLPLMTDEDQINFVLKSIKGGLTLGFLHHAKANNEMMLNFDPEKERSYLIDLDVVSLYGSIQMNNKLPFGDFKWLSEDEIGYLEKNLHELDDGEGDVGYWLEYHIKYPKHLHDFHARWPLLPERAFFFDGGQKLITTLLDKENYISHHSTLRQALDMGLELVSIKRGIKFSQKNWLAPYIKINLDKRAEKGQSKLYINVFKQIVNSLFGKLQENIHKRTNFKLINNEKKISSKTERKRLRLLANPLVKDFVIFNSDMVGIEMVRERVLFNRSIIMGACILEKAKNYMNKIFYDVIIPVFGNDNVIPLYTDTDSLILLCKNISPFIAIKQNSKYFDTSNFPEKNIFDIQPLNKKIPGLLCLESGMKIISEFVYLCPKSYCIIYNDFDKENTKKRAKGVSKSVIKEMSVEDFLSVLKNKNFIYKEMTRIASQGHNVFLSKYNKIALRFGCTKRVHINENFSLPYGHKDVDEFPKPFQIKCKDSREENNLKWK